MKRTLWSITLALALGACGAEAPVEQQSAEPAPVEEELPVIGEERTVLAFGDSLFAGYNLPEDDGYPERLERSLRAGGVNARVIDAGVSGNTTADGLARIGFVLDGLEEAPDLALVELGANDMLRGLPPAQARDNLAGILDALRARDIPVLLMGMRAPPNLGAQYQTDFDGMYAALAEEYGARLVPFWLEPVYDQPQLMQADRVHPTAEGIAELVAFTRGDVAAALEQVE